MAACAARPSSASRTSSDLAGTIQRPGTSGGSRETSGYGASNSVRLFAVVGRSASFGLPSADFGRSVLASAFHARTPLQLELSAKVAVL